MSQNNSFKMTIIPVCLDKQCIYVCFILEKSKQAKCSPEGKISPSPADTKYVNGVMLKI